MSPRAACRLETLGFEQVYEYTAGKVDWLARGLETEREQPLEARAGEAARDDVVTCSLGDGAAEVAERIDASPYGFALVTSEGGPCSAGCGGARSPPARSAAPRS